MSKELEALQYLKENKRKHWLEGDRSNECLEIVEKAIKALEVVKAKEVNVRDFMNVCKMPYEHYLYMWKDGHFMGVKMTSKEMLTQEEYYLLKEVFQKGELESL